MATAQSIMSVIRAVAPRLATAQERVAFAVHAAFFALGHLLVAFGLAALAENAFSTTSDDEVRINSHWNVVEDIYGFMYFKPDGTAPGKVRVKCRRAHDKLVVEVLKESARSPLCLELTIEEFAHDFGSRLSYFAQFKNMWRFAEILNREIFDKLDGHPARSQSSSSETDPRDYWPSRTWERVGGVHPRNPRTSSPPYGSQVLPRPWRSSGGGDSEIVLFGRRTTRSPPRAMQRFRRVRGDDEDDRSSV